MRVLLIGAGAVGSVISKLLSKEKSISEVICASNDLKRAKEFIDTKNSNVCLAKLDASNTNQVVKAAKGCDLIINASLPHFNEKIMTAALKVRVNYQDLCSRLKDLKTPEQLQFHKKFQKAKLVGLINAGIAPGITNLLAKEIADKLDKISEIKIRLIEDQKSSEFVFSWSPQVTLDELSARPLTYRNGRFQLLEPFGGTEEYDFPQPFGKRYAFNVYGDEISTIPRYIKVKRIDFKSSGTDIEFSKALYGLGLFSKKPFFLDGKKIIPLKFFSKIAPALPTPKEMIKLIESGIIENAVFASVVEGIKNIPKIDNYGVFPPEALSSDIRKEILIGLENKGIILDEQFSKA